MADVLVVCNAVEVFDLGEVRASVRAKQASGELSAGTPVKVEIRHPDREMDGSCRWCGCRANEIIEM